MKELATARRGAGPRVTSLLRTRSGSVIDISDAGENPKVIADVLRDRRDSRSPSKIKARMAADIAKRTGKRHYA